MLINIFLWIFLILFFGIEKAVVVADACECSQAKNLVPCKGSITYFPSYNCGDAYPNCYCNNLKCNYTINPNPACPNAMYKLQINFKLRVADVNDKDQIILYSSGHQDAIISSSSLESSLHNEFAYSSNAEVSLYFSAIDGPMNSTYFWYMYLTFLPSIQFLEINLSETNPTFTYWLDDINPYNGLTVCSPSTKELEMFIGNVDNSVIYLLELNLYDSNELKNFISFMDMDGIITPSKDNIPRHLKSNSGCFTIFRNGNDTIDNFKSGVFFRIPSIQSKGCQSSNNIFEVDNIGSNYLMDATDDGQCKMIIMSSGFNRPGIVFSEINSTSKDGKFTFKSVGNGKKYFDLDASKVSEWYNFGIYTPALSIILPASQGIRFKAKSFVESNTILNDYNNDAQSGIIVSPSFSNFTQPILKNTKLADFSLNVERNITFMVQEILGDSSVTLVNSDTNNNGTQKLSKGDKISIVGKNIEIWYYESDSTKGGVLIQYFIDGRHSDNSANSFIHGFSLLFIIFLSKVFFFKFLILI